MVPGSCMGHSLQHGPQTGFMQQHEPWATTWLQVATQTTHTNIPISSGSKAQGYHQGFSQQHRLHMSIWISGFITAWGISMDHKHQHGFLVISQTTVVLQGDPIQKVNCSSSLPRSRVTPHAGWHALGLSLRLHVLQVGTHHLADSTGQGHALLSINLSPNTCHH